MNWLRNLWRPARDLDPQPVVAEMPPMTISAAAVWDAKRFGGHVFSSDQTFSRARPMDGVIPSGMAMDRMPGITSMVNWAAESLYHEGLGFLGYPYLAELAQRAEYRLVSEKRAEHATRKWIKLRGPDDKIKAIDEELKRLGAKSAFRTALTQDGLFGRSQIFLDFGDADNDRELATPLVIDARKISPRRPLKRLNVVEPMWSYPAPYNSSNPLNSDFYKPSAWYVYGKTVHDSRMLTFIGSPVPDMLKPAYAFGGLSKTQMLKPYVDNWLRSRQSGSDLLNAFSTMVLATNMDAVLSGGSRDDLDRRADLYNIYRSNFGLFTVDKDTEELTSVNVPLSGVAENVQQSLEWLSAISGIPKVILLGITSMGLGASSNEEIRIFYTDIKSNEQERTSGDNVQRLIEVVQLSLFSAVDPEVTWEWEDLHEMDEKQAAEIDKLNSETHGNYVTMGAVSNDEVRETVAAEEDGIYHTIKLSGPAPEPEADETETEEK